MFGQTGRGEDEKQLDRLLIGGVPCDAQLMTAYDNHGPLEQIAHGIARMGKSQAIAHGGRVEALAVGKRLPERQLFRGSLAQFRNQLHQFAQHVVSYLA